MRRFRSRLLLLTIGLAASGAATAQAPNCVVRHDAFVEGGVAKAHMRLSNNGEACAFTFKFGGRFEPSSSRIEEGPRHGRVEVEQATIRYWPEPGFVGSDAFKVALFGYNPMLGHGHRARNGSFSFTVDVHATRKAL